MPVSSTHPDYDKALKRYKLIRAIMKNDAKCYIRKPDADNEYRNEQYAEDAILTNFTSLTCEAFVGLVFGKKPKISLPPELYYLLDDTTGTGINIFQFSQSSVSELLQVGRYGYLVDYDNDASEAYIKPYVAESIINWKTKSINGYVQPYLIVLEECILLDDEDIFAQETVVQYRVLYLSDDGIYHQIVMDASENIISDTIPLDYDGNPFQYIPFVFVGSKDNDCNIDKEPLYDMAVINLGHYRNSADYEESIFINGQPYLVVNVGDASAEDFTAANPQGVQYGSRKGLVLANGGAATLLQANPNQLVAQAMNEKLEQAAKIGARIIEPSGGRETAEAARIRFSSQVSALSIIAANASWGIESVLKTICRFQGASADAVSFQLNDDFYDTTADGNIMNAYTAWFDRGIVSANEMREYGREVGILDNSNEALQLAVDLTSDPLGDMAQNGNNVEGRNSQAPTPIDANGGDTGQGNQGISS